ncbi:MAG: putative DNA binding domain-containing protein [Candidatus Methanoplasma sp.]|nr:putative DNA binding domain-containing protein [Candidatus Methanoplasma sp.]
MDLLERRVVEGARIEYKKDWNPERVLHTICAFANDIDNWGGGYVVLGIDEENGRPKIPVSGLNVDSIDRTCKELVRICNLIEPRYIPVVEHAVYRDADILVIWVPGGDARPYKCPAKLVADRTKSEKAHYIRKASATMRANPSEEKELFQLSETLPFDDRANNNAVLQDLKPNLISDYLYGIESELFETSVDVSLTDLAYNLRLARGPPECVRPVNAGLMFFNDRPDNFFRYARIEVVDKPDPTGTGMTEKVFAGPLDRQLKDSLNYIKNYIITEKVVKIQGRPEAARFFNYPYSAVEEALSNAVYHKSYQIPEPITVTITPEMMEITSIPGPDRSISADDIKKRRMVSKFNRNRRIGDFLKELKLVEGRNTGVPLMVRAMQANGSELPVFDTDEDRTYFTAILPVHAGFIKNHDADGPLENKKRVRRTAEEVDRLLSDLLKKEGSLSMREISQKMGYSATTKGLIGAVGRMIDGGKAEYLYPDRVNSPNQKIRLRRE